MLCPGCGKNNPDGAKFCAYCAEPLSKSAKVDADADAYARFKRPTSDTRVRDGVVSSTGVTDRAPRRSAPIRPTRTMRTRPDTRVPRRKNTNDLFFEELDLPEEIPQEEAEEVGVVAHRIRSGIAGVILLAVLSFVFWLLVLPGGQAFQASLGMNTSAETYARLAEGYLQENSVRRAAEAYYDALRLEPDNYQYAYMVAKTQSLIGERTKALSAYAKCISLDPKAVEPYKEVAQIYQQMGDTDRMIDALAQGFERTGDVELLKTMQEAIKNKG